MNASLLRINLKIFFAMSCIHILYIFVKEELENAYSVAFSADGSKIYSGIRKFLRVFPIERPGNISEQRPRSGSINTLMLNLSN